MIVEITPEARDYLLKKVNLSAVTVRMTMCGG